MRTLNGFQIYNDIYLDLSKSGVLDGRFVRITGDNFVNDNFYFDYDFYKNQNFNISQSFTVFLSNDDKAYTGYLPDVTDKKSIKIKNLSSSIPVFLTGYQNQRFDYADSTLNLPSPVCVDLVGIRRDDYTGWVSINSTAGIS